MNRIILIGNGFDLAHGIKTSYGNFISNYWEKIIEQFNTIVSNNPTTLNRTFENEEIKIEKIKSGVWSNGQIVNGNSFDDLINCINSQNLEIVFKNKFLEILTKKNYEQNWVDIENEYYNLLKKSFKEENCSYKIKELNKDFNCIQKLLELYLKEVEEKFKTTFGSNNEDLKLKNNIGSKIYSPFNMKDFTEASINKKSEIEFQKVQDVINPSKENLDILETISELNPKIQNIINRTGKNIKVKEIRELLISDSAINYFELMPKEILFLSFNYTFTEKFYSENIQFEPFESNKGLIKKYIHIHGTTNKNDKNDVIFGFGDEIDDDYRAIENLNDNDYLDNIKSIKYLETDNYKQLLEFLNSNEYQIFIFGHSCGISDRTLLNTLFEHKNCASVKPFYHKKADGDDNFSDLIKNISRNFNSKTLMRDKVVNKIYCESLS